MLFHNKISATVIIVQDLEKCTKFYQDILGLEELFSDAASIGFRMEDHDFLLLKSSAAADMVGDEMLLHDNKAGSRVLLCVGVEDVDASYKALMARGLTFIKAPKSQAWGRRTAYFVDPEGNLWELWHELPADS